MLLKVVESWMILEMVAGRVNHYLYWGDIWSVADSAVFQRTGDRLLRYGKS